jgi:hypothetical protein
MARLHRTLPGLFVAATLGCLSVDLGSLVSADTPGAAERPEDSTANGTSCKRCVVGEAACEPMRHLRRKLPE